MIQIILGNVNDSVSKTVIEYTGFSGCRDWTDAGNINGCKQLISAPGTLSNLRIELSAAPGASGVYTFKLQNLTQSTELTVAITDPATTGVDAGSIDVVAGDVMVMECTPTNTPSIQPRARWSVKFTSTNPKESNIPGVAFTQPGGARYGAICANRTSSSTTEAWYKVVIPTAGKLKNLYVELTTDPGTPPDAYTYTIRKNGVDTALAVTVVANDTTGNNVTDEVDVVAGDLITIKIAPTAGSPPSFITTWTGLTFEATIDGEFLFLGYSSDPVHTSATEYSFQQIGQRENWGGTESFLYSYMQSCVIKKLYVELPTAPGAGKSFAFNVRVGGTARLTATIADTDKTGNSGGTEYAVSDGDNGSLQCVPSGSPSVSAPHWGMVGHILLGWAGGDVLGVDIATVSKINGVALVDITKVNGVA